MEEWKSIENYPLYEVSNYGFVRNKRTQKISLGWDRGLGYKKAKLYNGKNYKSFYIHRLVAIAFLEKIDGKNDVNHIDFNPSNNKVENLEWCSHSENIKHSSNAGRMSATKLIILNKDNGIFYYGINDAAESIAIKPNTLVCKLTGKLKNKTNLIVT
jgi:hypothetical protein